MRKMGVALILATTGCASIVNGGNQRVTIQSPVPDAEIHVKSFKGREVYSGPSPARLKVARDDQYTVEVMAPGYKPQKQVISKSMSGWTFGNLIWILPPLWGVGLAVDAMSGGLWTLDPDDLVIGLVRAQQAAPTTAAPASSSEPPPKPEEASPTP